ncbi:MAG: ion transporter, partial [Lachnospiraceae bacterium]|nr:ion transporter [Lachnospiraceae bacterium]
MDKTKKRISEIIQIGNKTDIPSAAFDVFIVIVIFINLFVTLALTFEQLKPFDKGLKTLEFVTIIIFLVEYILRIWTAECIYKEESRMKSKLKFLFSFYGLIDFFTIVPYFIPNFMSTGVTAFRLFRVIRIFRLFKINAQYDAFNVIVDVLYEKKNQIFSSIVMVLTLMLASSLCMYGLEHEAQPDKFANAFSGIWWSMSTLLTVGYGDIYPITTLGKLMAIVIAFLGVGMVAIPTGIISAGFVERYTKVKSIATYGEENGVDFIISTIKSNHQWCHKNIKDIVMPPNMAIAIIERDEDIITLSEKTIIEEEDNVVLVNKNFNKSEDMELKKVIIKEEHEWADKKVKELNISQNETVALIKRKNKNFAPVRDTI